jgi:hypothetical protein
MWKCVGEGMKYENEMRRLNEEIKWGNKTGEF